MNNLAQPATILGHNQAIDAYKGYVDKVLADVEQKKQLEALKQKGINEALLPPDIDVKGTFAPELTEITSDLDKYSQYKADLASQGQDITTPEYQNVFYQHENKLKNKATISMQHQAGYAKAIENLSAKDADKYYDIEASQKKLAEFVKAAKDGGVYGAEDYIKQNGSLLVPKAFDPYKFGNEVAETYKTTVTTTDPQKIGGRYVTTTTEEVTPENRLGAGTQLYANPQMKIETDFYYDSLSPQAKADYEQQAILAGGGQGDGVKMFAAQKWADPHWSSKVTKTSAAIPQGKGSKQVTPTRSNTIIDQTMAALNGDTEVTRKEANGLVVLPVLEGMAIGTFEQNTPILKGKDPNTGQLVYADDFKTTPILVEKVFQDEKGNWYYTTNETKANKRGKTVNGVNNALPFTGAAAQSVVAKAAVSAGDMTMKDVDAYLDKFKENGILKVGNSSANNKEIYFEGQSYTVPMSKIDKSGGTPVATLEDGRKVEWNGKEWVKYEGKTTKTTTKTAPLTKGSLNDL